MTGRRNYLVSSSQAKRLSMNDLAAIKVIKLEPGERTVRRVFEVVWSSRAVFFIGAFVSQFFVCCGTSSFVM